MLNSIRQAPARWIAGIVVLVGVVAWLAFGVFGVQTLFIDDVVEEAAPTFETPTVPAPSSVDAAITTATSSPASGADTTTTPAVATEPTEPAEPQVVTEAAGMFVDGAHPTSGEAQVLGNGTGQRFLRFVDFKTDNGPDLNVYLVNSSTGDVSDYIDLGDLKGNVGDQNYEIPAEVDLAKYDTVWIWCVRFSAGFGSATLS